jgi:hypothetical protein
MGGEGQNVGVSVSLWWAGRTGHSRIEQDKRAGLEKAGQDMVLGREDKHDRCENGQRRVAGKDKTSQDTEHRQFSEWSWSVIGTILAIWDTVTSLKSKIEFL